MKFIKWLLKWFAWFVFGVITLSLWKLFTMIHPGGVQ